VTETYEVRIFRQPKGWRVTAGGWDLGYRSTKWGARVAAWWFIRSRRKEAQTP
jgi:hypothetical protein